MGLDERDRRICACGAIDMSRSSVLTAGLLLAALISTASGASWTGGVDNVTDGSSFWISRQSANMSFDLTSSVEGVIAPIAVTPTGRLLSPYYSGMADIDANDVRLRERTAALPE